MSLPTATIAKNEKIWLPNTCEGRYKACSLLETRQVCSPNNKLESLILQRAEEEGAHASLEGEFIFITLSIQAGLRACFCVCPRPATALEETETLALYANRK
ncbi:hypothetical protein ACP6JE_004518 [Aspergillus fumigatus]